MFKNAPLYAKTIIMMLIAVWLTGCDKLERDYAKEKLLPSSKYDFIKTVNFDVVTKKFVVDDKEYPTEDNMIYSMIFRRDNYSCDSYCKANLAGSVCKKLGNRDGQELNYVEAGIFTCSYIGTYKNGGLPNYAYMTSVVNEYTNDILCQDVDSFGAYSKNCLFTIGKFDELTIDSISDPSDAMGRKVSIVSYTIKYKTTNLGHKISPIFNENFNSITEKKTATFVKTDNGWELSTR